MLTQVPVVPRLLGLSGLIPFAAAAAGAWLLPRWDALLIAGVGLLYGAVILSFLGGVRWGASMAAGAAPRPYVEAVIPSLFAWCAAGLGILWKAEQGLLLMAAGLLALGLSDAARAGGLFPLWYRPLRLVLSVCAALLLCVTALAVYLRF